MTSTGDDGGSAPLGALAAGVVEWLRDRSRGDRRAEDPRDDPDGPSRDSEPPGRFVVDGDGARPLDAQGGPIEPSGLADSPTGVSPAGGDDDGPLADHDVGIAPGEASRGVPATDGGSSDLEERVADLEDEVETLSSAVATQDREFEQVRLSLDRIQGDLRTLIEVFQSAAADGPTASQGDDDDPSTPAQDERRGPAERETIDPIDPEVESRLRDLRERFEGQAGADSSRSRADSTGEDGDADRDSSSDPDRGSRTGTGRRDGGARDGRRSAGVRSKQPSLGDDEFRFRKVVFPDEEDAPPEVVGEDLEKPYLEAIEGGYAAEALVMEWLDWLVSESDAATALSTIAYYADVGWISEEVADDLRSYLDGLVEGDVAEAPPGRPERLDREVHLGSLEYLLELSDPPGDAEVLRDGL